MLKLSSGIYREIEQEQNAEEERDKQLDNMGVNQILKVP